MKAAACLKTLHLGVPLIATLRQYRLSWLSRDAVAGLSACIVMIPSVLAYAELVHLPPITGLYAALAASIGYALFASSHHVIAGPDAAIGLLAGSAILPLALDDPQRPAMLAALLSLLSGAVLLLATRLKLGVIADLLSRPVLTGTDADVALNRDAAKVWADSAGVVDGLPIWWLPGRTADLSAERAPCVIGQVGLNVAAEALRVGVGMPSTRACGRFDFGPDLIPGDTRARQNQPKKVSNFFTT